MKRTSAFALATLAAVSLSTGVHAMGETPKQEQASAATATTAETEHRMATLQTGMLAMESSRVAISRSSNMMVKQFAQAEIDEQTTIATVFKSMYPDMPEVKLNAENTAKLNQLKNAPSAGFDKAYVAMQIEGHNMLLEAQDDYISGAQNREEMNVAKLARGQIKDHLKLLTAFQMHAR
ncbi:MAG: DUF4142 domain-containing protein [Alphaproteobacteria bacterium]|nr:MAG: DUF4142 domain-containing protein [Alphaproteobacteria bacterium]